jgi:CubicO group peptidase (beta-lactamase class C family)
MRYPGTQTRKVLLGLIALPFVAFALLYLSNKVVAERYIDLFSPEDGTFASLQPREAVPGVTGDDFPIAGYGYRTIRQDALDEMTRYAAEQDSWALIVMQYGVIQAEWYAEGWDRERQTQSQSMHKSILPILIQAAIEDGHIGSLEDRIGDYLVEWRTDERGDITIEQMLWMSSGLLEYSFSLNPWSDAFRWLFDTDITPVLLRTPLDWTPGAKFQYNNVNSELLGLIIERATGQRYAEYLAERLWQPMGASGAELWLDSAGGKAHSSCCLLAPAMDWAKFGQLLLNRGAISEKHGEQDGEQDDEEDNEQQIVSAEFIDRMVTPSPTFDWYGYQIWLGYSRELNPRAPKLAGGYQRTDPFIAEDTYYASGFGAQRVYVVPSAELVIVRMGPSSGREPVRESWDNTFLVNTALRNQVH